ncbi:thioester-containing protein 1 [Anopheles sinensis]|uniref:TEP1-F n=1 Tax=Anopheles sinensis TaxID=74873 RepID=A0A084VEA2_ANOSI|nr:thioester-containing protein 1 [Anopheles sinensis]
MFQFVRSRLFVAITLFSATHGLLVVGPKFIRSNQNYTLVLTNFNSSLYNVELKVQIDGTTHGGETILNLTRTVDVQQFQNRLVTFEFPNLVPGNYKITLVGQRGFNFYEETDLILKTKSVSGLIQLDKPVFKPGDTVNFRVIVLDSKLKPPANVKTVNVTIQDPRGHVIRKWSAGRLHVGVFENKFDIPPAPLLGMWKITVNDDEEDLVTKSFQVQEYVPSTFEIDVYPTKVPLEKDQALDLTLTAKYFTGNPVQGTAVLHLYLKHGLLDQKKTWQVDGMRQVQLNFKRNLYIYDPQQDVHVNFTFIEEYTNRTLTKYKPITVYQSQYRVELVKESPTFRPGMPYKCDIHVKYQDGTPAANVETEVTIVGCNDEYVKTRTSDKNGMIKQTLLPSADSETINIEVKIDGNDLLDENIDKVEIATDAYVKIELKSQ